MSIPDVDTARGWLAEDELAEVRDRVPLVYVDAVPVRLDHLGRVTKVGLLLRVRAGSITRAVVTGRVMLGETVREALWRHLTKDLGPQCAPQLPAQPAPFTVVEYFPDPSRTGFTDERHHAVSLAYLVPVTGEVEPHDALEVAWLSVEEALSPQILAELGSGHDRLLQMALAAAGRLP